MTPRPARPSTLRRRLAVGAIVATLAAAVASPAVAGADSIVYVKGGDVWLSTPDGARQFQVTRDGGYSYASQSDDGSVIVAAKARQLYTLNRTGESVREIPTIIGSNAWFGPYEPQVSPDGTHIAYQYYTSDARTGTSGVAYANTDGSTSGYPLHTGWGYPAWIDNGSLMHSDPPNGLSQDVIVRAFGSGNNTGDQWFNHRPTYSKLRDGDIRGNRLAFVTGTGGEFLTVYRFDGPVGSPTIPMSCYRYGDAAGGAFESPAFSGSGGSLAWGEGDGIHVGPVADLSGGCANPADGGALVIPGGRYPDWSAAEVPADRPVDGGSPGPGGGPGPGTGGGGKGNTNGGGNGSTGKGDGTTKLAVGLPKKLTAKAIRSGATLKVTVPGAGKLSLTLFRGSGKKGVKVASGTATAKTAGTVKVRLKAVKAQRSKLKRGSFRLVAKLQPASGKAATATRTLKLR